MGSLVAKVADLNPLSVVKSISHDFSVYVLNSCKSNCDCCGCWTFGFQTYETHDDEEPTPQHIHCAALNSAGLRADLINLVAQGLWQPVQLVAGEPAFEMSTASSLGRIQVLIVNKVRPITKLGAPTGTIRPQSRSLTIQPLTQTTINSRKLQMSHNISRL